MSGAKFGIVIPCFNEEKNLSKLIEECAFLAKEMRYQFVLVDNGSSDNSQETLSRVNNPSIKTMRIEENAGYGGGILAGLRILDNEYVGWIHADLQTDLRESLSMLQGLEFDYFKGIRIGRTLSEKFFSAGMGLICSSLFRVRLFEINAQPTLMKRSLFDSWVNPPEDFSLDLYSFVIAKKRKCRIHRTKFVFSKRTSGHSTWNFGFRSRVKMILRTLNYAISLSKMGVK